MIEILNQNQGVIAIIGIVVAILLSFFGVKKVINIKQTQKSGNNSTNIQIGNINKGNKND